jgi:hypothetical protein
VVRNHGRVRPIAVTRSEQSEKYGKAMPVSIWGVERVRWDQPNFVDLDLAPQIDLHPLRRVRRIARIASKAVGPAGLTADGQAEIKYDFQ